MSLSILMFAFQGPAWARTMLVTPPGSNNLWVLWDFGDIIRTQHVPDPQAPGASSITLIVEDIQALTDRIRATGMTIETSGGQPIALDNGRRTILVRSWDGLLVELVE